MRFGIPVFGNRIAPRCNFADKIVLLDLENNHVENEQSLRLERKTPVDLVTLLQDHQVDTLVCGGIIKDTLSSIQSLNISVIENVSGDFKNIKEAIRKGTVYPGYGFGSSERSNKKTSDEILLADQPTPNITSKDRVSDTGMNYEINCLNCQDRRCLSGESCALSNGYKATSNNVDAKNILAIAGNLELDNQGQLCRISELVHFCLDMGYKKVGVAFCYDLTDAARILVEVLDRFFEVLPVCCKVVSGQPRIKESKDQSGFCCNPQAQADLLNRWGSDINVIVGLCIGADCLFNQDSQAPVTTLFVKDKSLANNPIGAIYSHYYLGEISKPPRALH